MRAVRRRAAALGFGDAVARDVSASAAIAMSALPRTTRVRGFAPYEPRESALQTIVDVKAVLEDYREQLPLTLRQVFYVLVGRELLTKCEKTYKQLGEILNRARRGELVSFDCIRDDGLTSLEPFSCADAADGIATLGRYLASMQIDRQAGQARRLRVWCEAGGMAPQLERVVAKYGIPVMSSGGFDSTTIKHEFARSIADEGAVTVLHLGDFDPSGVHVFSSLEEDIGAFGDYYGCDVQFVRLAVTEAQIAKDCLPTTPPKLTDRRSFAADYTVQCEALDPRRLAQILDEAVASRLDDAAYRAALDREHHYKAEIAGRLNL